MIRDGRRREKAGELEPAVAVRRAHHGDLDALVAQAGDAPALTRAQVEQTPQVKF